jgi:DNA-binding transcriptional ArsR family regulator
MDDAEAERLAELMSAFSTASRVRILYGLYDGDLAVDDLAAAIDLPSSLVSQQLRVLRLHRLVTGHKDGRRVRYRLADDHVRDLLAAVRAHGDH